ncbi:MAG: STAS domain-containing protein, partial [Balneolales bacterium]|nr:STAS domain-containing protein [Balneolales bacterium]
SGLPGFTTSFIAAEDIALLMPVILVIALISYLESIAVAKTIATKRGYELDSNKELIALGAANIGGAFFQSFPTTGGFSRTAVNDQVSSHTTISSLVSVALVALTVLFFTPLFYYLPAAVLGAIIMVAVFGLLDVAEMKHLWHTDRRDFALLMITFLVTLLIGIKEGIATGVVLSLTMVIYRSTRPQVAELGELGNTGIYRNVLRYPEAVKRDDLLVFRFDDALYFANASYFKDEIASKIRARGNRLKKVILVATSMTDIDSTGTQVLVSLVQALQDDGKELVIAGATGPVRDYLRKSGLMNLLGENHFFFDVKDAVEACSAELPDPSTLEFSPTQTN